MPITKQSFVHHLSPETYEAIAKLGRKLDFKPLIDFCSDDGSARIIHDGCSYTIDSNGRCTIYTSIDQDFDLDPEPSNPSRLS